MEFGSLPHYNISKSSEGSYIFITSAGITYNLDFIESVHFKNYPGQVYEISFWPEENKHSNLDTKIRNTLFNAVAKVLTNDNTNAIVFVCDSSDKKQLARKKLFDNWYNSAKTKVFEKIDNELLIGEGEIYYNSIITLKHNPFRKQLLDCYSEVIELYTK